MRRSISIDLVYRLFMPGMRIAKPTLSCLSVSLQVGQKSLQSLWRRNRINAERAKVSGVAGVSAGDGCFGGLPVCVGAGGWEMGAGDCLSGCFRSSRMAAGHDASCPSCDGKSGQTLLNAWMSALSRIVNISRVGLAFA